MTDVNKRKASQAAHYQKNKELYKQRAVAFREKKRQKVREAKDHPCVDCGIKYPYYVMQLDHLRDKEFQFSDIAAIPLKKFDEELAKCEVVCANCHAERTHQRRQETS